MDARDEDVRDRSDERSSIRVRRAIGGERESLEWVVRRFTPVLLAQAEYRIGRELRRHVDPEDVVEDVWISAWPHLPELRPDQGREAATMLRYLSTAVLRRVQQLAEKHVLGKPGRESGLARRDRSAATGGIGGWLEDSSSSPASKIVRSETRSAVRALVDSLDAPDREVLVLRGIEQWTLAETAAFLEVSTNVVAVRYHRALKRLRDRIPDSVFHDFVDGPPPVAS